MSEAIVSIKLNDESYPRLLGQIHDPPKILYCRGNLEILQFPSLAIVGSRNATAYGKKHAQIIAADLARMGFCIVSGLAYGVDSWAHEAALETGRAIGVIAGGLDNPLQSWQQKIAKKILAKGGALVSEFPGNTPALKHHFPLRNRIIAGLSHGTIIIEARDKSGALITAKAALDSNRIVFALPGDIDRPTSAGALGLIKNGAVLIRCALDVKKELVNQLSSQILELLPKNEYEELLAVLEKQKITTEQLSKLLNKPLSVLLPLLSRLELDGQILRLPDNSYTLKI